METGGLTVKSIASALDINLIYARRLFQLSQKNSTLDDIRKIVEDKPKPFVKWVGGKRQLLKQFRELNLYPPECFNPESNTYFEPFVGGGAVFFDLLPKRAELSDTNRELVMTYNVIKDNVDGLIKSLKKHIYNKEALQGITITHRDYKDVLELAKIGDFIYFDPPYYPLNPTSSFTAYTAKGFFEKEQIELRDTFVKLHERGCFVMLSNSDTPFINELYSELEGVSINKIIAGRAINSKGSKRGKINEVLITNYQA